MSNILLEHGLLGGGGIGGGSSNYNEIVFSKKLSTDTNFIKVEVKEFNPSKDRITVYRDGIFLTPGKYYEIDATNKGIKKIPDKLGINWQKDNEFDIVVKQKVIKKHKGTDLVYQYDDYIKLEKETNRLSINIAEYDPNTDFLNVFKDGILLSEGRQYKFFSDSKTIEKIKDNWGESWEIGAQFDFKVLKNVIMQFDSANNVSMITNYIKLDKPKDTVVTGFNNIDTSKDYLTVYKNGTMLTKDKQYSFNGVKNTITKIADDDGDTWAKDTEFDFQLLKNKVADLKELIPDIKQLVKEYKIIELTNRVVLKDDTNTVNIDVKGYNPTEDILEVFEDGTRLINDINYVFSDNKTAIESKDKTNWDKNTCFDFVIKKIIQK